METETETNTTQTQQTQQQAPVKWSDVKVDSQNVALNVMMTLLSVAQQKGAFNFEESAKIWECIQVFKPAEEKN